MIERTEYDDVTAFRLTWWRSRLVNLGVHVFIVRNVLIDTGFPAARPDVEALVDLLAVRGTPLRGVVLTHWHEDHAGNASWLTQRGIPIAMSAATREIVQVRQRIGLYRHITWTAMEPIAAPFASFEEPSLSLHHSPGHSLDHHVVWDNDTGTVFAGDLFLGVKVSVAHSYEQPLAHVASLRDVIARRPSRVFCAHRGLLPDGVGMLAAKADWMEQTIDHILRLHDTGVPVNEIRQRVFGSLGSSHWFSFGDYSPLHLVRAVIRDAVPMATPIDDASARRAHR